MAPATDSRAPRLWIDASAAPLTFRSRTSADLQVTDKMRNIADQDRNC